MINTSRTDNLEPENHENGFIYTISEQISNDMILEPKTVYLSELSVKIDHQYASDSIIIFKLTGDMLQSTISSLRNILHVNKQKYTYVILDMRDVRIINSAGWGLFIAEQKNLKMEPCTLFLTNFKLPLQQIFESLQLNLMIQCYSTVTDCLNHIYSKIKIDTLVKPSEHYPIIQYRVMQEHSNDVPQSCDLSNAPMECIHNTIVKYGPCSFFKLLSILQSTENKKLKIGLLKLRSLLKHMMLDTFEKRLRYFRSC